MLISATSAKKSVRTGSRRSSVSAIATTPRQRRTAGADKNVCALQPAQTWSADILVCASPGYYCRTLTESERIQLYACNLAFAAFGFATAMATQPFWARAAKASQVPGTMRAQGLDARGPFWFTVTLVVLPLIVAVATGGLSEMLATGQTWARVT